MTVDPIPRDWKIGDHTLWASFTRAIRLPSRSTDDILVYPVGSPIEVVVGNPDVVSEEVLAYEAGYRVEPIDRVQIDLAGYYNDYDNVLSLEMTPGGPLGLPVVWGNLIAGDGYGVELSAGYKPWDWIEVGISYTWARLDLHQKVGGTSDDIGDVGIGTSRVDEALPEHMLSVRLSLDLPYDIEFDTYVYYMDEIRLFPIDSYVRLDFRVGWAPTEWLELAGAVQNVTDDSHQEWQYEFQFTETLVPRGYWVGATLRF